MSNQTSLNGHMQGNQHVFPIRVYYEDTDAGGIVYHSHYLNFAERARSAFLHCHGLSNREITDCHKVAIAVRKAEIDFMKAAQLEDELQVVTQLDKLGGASMRMAQRIERHGEVICEIKTVLVSMCLETLKAKRLPAELVQLFRAIQADGDEDGSV